MENIEVLYSELEAKSKADQDLTESTSSFFKEKLSNVTEKNKNQILIYAVQKRTINIIRYFVRAEIKVTLPLKTETAIHIAIKCNSTEYFDLLFYVYGNVNYKTVNKKSKFSHFQAACMTSNVQRVQNFIDAGVDVNAGKPLLEAIERKNFEVIKFLLKSGANANVVDKRGRTPLQLIFSQFSDGTEYETNFELFRLLIKAKSDVNKTDKNGNSPMFYLLDRDLCIDNKKKTLEILLQNGADVTHVNKFGYSIMHYVFGCKNRKERDTFELIELFLKHGAHVNATDKWGLTPLHLICSQLSNIKDHGHEFAINTIKLLFINGANINTVNRFGRTPINCLWSQLSNIKNHGDEFVIHIIELLLSNGVDINTAVDSSGRTPINSLCSKLGRDSKNDSNLKLLQVLIKYKSDVNRKDKEGHHTLFNLFGESCGSSLQWDALKILLQNGANVTYINSAGDTILHHLIKLKYENEKHFIDIYELLLILIKYKSDVNRKDKEGNSPMFNLFKRGWMNYAQKDALDILIQSGADVTHTNDTDDSVLHHLIYTDYKNQEYAMDIIELLLSNGADVDAVDTFVKLLLGLGADIDTVNFQDGLFKLDNQSLPNLETTQNILSIIELLESKGFFMKNDHHNAVLKFFTAYDLQDFTGRIRRIDFNYLFRLGNIATIDKFIQPSKEQASWEWGGREALYISTYLEILRNLYITKNGNFYMDVEDHEIRRNEYFAKLLALQFNESEKTLSHPHDLFSSIKSIQIK
ncbi:hypothetical protein TKK_0003936 [Trichogramma kaykai]